MNNKGFTLVELLAVLIILTVIMGIAIPSISSSLERTKIKQNDSKKKIIVTAAEEFVTDHKNEVYANLDTEGCKIEINLLGDYLSEGAFEDADGNEIGGFVVFNKPSSYRYCAGASDNGCDVNKDCITTNN